MKRPNHISDRLGEPVPMPPNKEIVNDGVIDIPGINWEISPETIKAIEEIEDHQKRSVAYLAYCWHYYV